MFSTIPQKGLVSDMLTILLLTILMIPTLFFLAIPIVILATLQDGLRELGFSDKEMTIW